MANHDHTFGLVLAFDSDDPEFARGVEVGMMYEAVQRTEPWDSYACSIRGSNTEMALRIAEASHRTIEPHDTDPEWISVEFGPVQ